MSRKNPVVYAKFILNCIRDIEEFTEEDPASLEDKRTYRAIINTLEMLADCTAQLPEEVKQSAPDVPWRQIKDFRNVLAHQYMYGYDNDIIWQVIVKELPKVKGVLTNYLRKP